MEESHIHTLNWSTFLLARPQDNRKRLLPSSLHLDLAPSMIAVMSTCIYWIFLPLLKEWKLLLILCDVHGRCSDEANPRKQPYKMSNQKLQDLGLEFRPVSQSLYETVKSLQEKGHLRVLSEQTETDKETPNAELQIGVTIQAWGRRNHKETASNVHTVTVL